MSEEVSTLTKRTQFVWVKDKSGNEYVCNAEYLQDPKNISEEDLKNCVDDASVAQPHAGG